MCLLIICGHSQHICIECRFLLYCLRLVASDTCSRRDANNSIAAAVLGCVWNRLDIFLAASPFESARRLLLAEDVDFLKGAYKSLMHLRQ
jgi:hypothetical protein